MTITNSKSHRKITVYLDGPEGNAFNLIGIAANLAKQLGFSKKEIKDMRDELMSKDYNHLVKTMDGLFGPVVNFVTESPEKYQ